MQNHVLDYMWETVKRVPDKIAFSNGTDSLTFREVEEHTRKIGSFLHKKNIYKEPVIIFMNKHPKMITAFFGTIMGGNYYVPIDAEMPEVRIKLILENVKPRLMICDEASVSAASKFSFDGEVILYDDLLNTEIDEDALTNIHDLAIDTDPIYIVFTSGSTGIPKGVVACHRSVIDYIEQLTDVLRIDEDTVFGNQTPLYVDACLKELYPTLKFGATTYLIPKELFMFPVKLVSFLNEHKINTVCWVVSALVMISAFGAFKTAVPKFLRLVAFGSEAFPIKQFKIWREVLPDARFINLYGPTEGTGMCCHYEVDRTFEEGDVIPIGRPFKNTEILLLSEKGERVKEGEVGEICIRGTSLTLGYYNNPEKTAECFVQNPLNHFYPELIYKTGDLGRLNKRGELEFVSRKDYQIKHMGHRIELGEIEANVNLMDEVKMSGCIYDDARGRIVLYYVGDITEKDMALSLKEKLPRYMVPNSINRLEKMLLTDNGKLDRNGLKKLYREGK
ncbi:MAG: amino acid adenylation domain-containing protein [Lachnospiraceae bacterium]|nr:amino acid adenylation domain-containing protein [Lachnospiraceae bacterium]